MRKKLCACLCRLRASDFHSTHRGLISALFPYLSFHRRKVVCHRNDGGQGAGVIFVMFLDAEYQLAPTEKNPTPPAIVA